MTKTEKRSNNVDLLEIIKELKDSDFNEIELEFGKTKLKLSRNKSIQPVDIQPEVPSQPEFEHDVDYKMNEEEDVDILSRARERDNNLLDELVYDPDTTCDLLEAGVIRQKSNGRYEYCEEV